MTTRIYTDGSCYGTPGPGAAAAVFVQGSMPRFSIVEHHKKTTNQLMELHAGILALETAKTLGIKKPEIYTDSNYLLKGATEWIENWRMNGWRTSNGKPVKNREIWERFYELYLRDTPKIVKVKAHSGDPYNELADRLAKSCAKGEK